MPKAAKGIIVGAIIGVAAAFVLPALGVATIMGAAITVKGAAIAGAIYGGLLGAAAMLAPNMDMGAAQQRTQLSVNPQASGKWVFGETPSGLDIVHQETIGDDRVFMVVAAAAHEIDSFGDLYIDDELITFSGTGFTGLTATGSWAGALTKVERLGRTTDAAISAPGQWNANATGKGIAHFSLDFDFSSENENLENGIPQKMVQIVKGSKVYDPRLDSTKGGSGAHRVDDQSTWEWSDNWALIVAHYLVGYRQAGQLVYGVGVNPDDIDWPQVIAMANVCDETVDGIPRYRVGGLFATTQDHEQIIGQLEAAVGGKVAKVGGKYYIWCPHNDLIPINTLTEDDIIRDAGINFSPSGPLRDLFNTARGRFVDPSLLWQPGPYPTITEPDAVTEDGRERLMDRDFSIIQDRSIAERVAREMVRRTRFSATWTLAVGPAGLIYQPFSVLRLNLPETGGQNVLVRVIDMEFSPEGIVMLSLLEEDESIYDTTLPLGNPFVSTVPDGFDPTKVYEVDNLDASPITVTGAGGTQSDAFSVTWDDPGPFVRDTEIRYRVAGDADFSYVQATRIASAVIVPVEPNTLYEIQARHISISEVKGPYASIERTSGDTQRSRAISGSVEYDPTNAWQFDPVAGNAFPNQALEAVFTFRQAGNVIATRTMEATVDPSDGSITVDIDKASTGETTVGALSGTGRAVAIRATHVESGTLVTGQFTATEVEQPVTGSVTYSQSNNWSWNPDTNEIDPTSTTNDATFQFRRGTEVIAERVIRGTIDTDNGSISVNPNQSQSGDDTTPAVQFDNSFGPQIRVTHDASGLVVQGEFTTNRSQLVDLTPFIDDLDQLQDDLDALEIDLDSRFPITETQIDDDAISTPKLQANVVTTPKIQAGAVTAIKISVGNLAAINARTGRLTSDIIQTAPAGQRLELTNPETDSTYALWIGDGSNGVFGSISNATQTNPVVITSSSHGLATGAEIGIRGVAGMTEINGKVYTVTVINANQFSLDAEDGTNYGAYSSGGVWQPYVKNDAAGTVWFKHNGDAKIDGGTLTTGLIQSSNYEQGTLGFVMGLDNGAAEFSNIVARGNVIAGPATGERVEVTTLNPTGTPRDYRIWIGDGTKNDANGVFWVDADGVAKIDGGTFNIGTRGDSATASNTALASKGDNTLVVSTGDFLSNGNAVNITGVAAYFASKSTTGTCSAEYSTAPAGLSGDLRVQRSTDGGSTWTNVGSLVEFSAPTNTQDFGQSPDPVVCFASVNLDKTFTVLDTAPPSGDVRYRIIYDDWASFFTTGQTSTNRLEITALQG